MKKLLPILGLSLLLVGCGSATTTIDSSVTAGKEVIIEGEEISVTKNDIYHTLMKENGITEIFNISLNYIADKEITDADAIEAKVNETIEQYAQYMENGIDAYAQQLGYESGDEYVENLLRPKAKQQLLKEKYLTDNLDTIIKDYQVRYIKTISVETESAAMEIIDNSKTVEAFDAFLGSEDKNGTDVGIVTKENTTVDENIISALDKFTADGIYSKAIKTTDNKYTVVYVYNTDTKDLKEDIKTHLRTLASIETDYEVHYLKKYKFKVYENKMKQEIDDLNKDYLG